jgi:prepilin-type N-terminal cleavage/methylation domain-containing protein
MKHADSKLMRGFTLLEVLAAVLIMGVIGAVVLPVVTTASESYTVTRYVRNSTERVAFALDRVSRVVRQAPIGADDTGIGVQSASASSLEFTDGTGFRLEAGNLVMLVPGEDAALLCEDVDTLEISYLGADGVTSTLATPTETHRIVVTMGVGQLRMSVLAHPRVWIGQEAEE